MQRVAAARSGKGRFATRHLPGRLAARCVVRDVPGRAPQADAVTKNGLEQGNGRPRLRPMRMAAWCAVCLVAAHLAAQSPDAALGEARRHRLNGEPVVALKVLDAAAAAHPGQAALHFERGALLAELARLPEAVEALRTGLELDPSNTEAQLNLGLALAGQGLFADAERSLAEGLRLAPDNISVRRELGRVLTRLGRSLEAIPHFERIARAEPGSAQARLDLGIAYAESGRLADALEVFEDAVRIAPDSSRPHYNLGRVLHDVGRTNEARRALEKAIGLEPGFAPALQLLGEVERLLGNPERSAELLELVTKAEPGNAGAHYGLALSLAQAGKTDAAVLRWEQVIALDPRHKEALYNLAQALLDIDPARSREYRERFAALKAEEQTTDRAGALWNFALAEAKRERWAKAFQLFRQALEACGSCPAKGQIHKNFGLVYGHAGDYANAEAELAKALELLPQDTEIQEALRVVRQAGRTSR